MTVVDGGFGPQGSTALAGLVIPIVAPVMAETSCCIAASMGPERCPGRRAGMARGPGTA